MKRIISRFVFSKFKSIHRCTYIIIIIKFCTRKELFVEDEWSQLWEISNSETTAVAWKGIEKGRSCNRDYCSGNTFDVGGRWWISLLMEVINVPWFKGSFNLLHPLHRKRRVSNKTGDSFKNTWTPSETKKKKKQSTFITEKN